MEARLTTKTVIEKDVEIVARIPMEKGGEYDGEMLVVRLG